MPKICRLISQTKVILTKRIFRVDKSNEWIIYEKNLERKKYFERDLEDGNFDTCNNCDICHQK